MTWIKDRLGRFLISCSLIQEEYYEQPLDIEDRTGIRDHDRNHLQWPSSGPAQRD
jgi:hypothetical protein